MKRFICLLSLLLSCLPVYLYANDMEQDHPCLDCHETAMLALTIGDTDAVSTR